VDILSAQKSRKITINLVGWTSCLPKNPKDGQDAHPTKLTKSFFLVPILGMGMNDRRLCLRLHFNYTRGRAS